MHDLNYNWHGKDGGIKKKEMYALITGKPSTKPMQWQSLRDWMLRSFRVQTQTSQFLSAGYRNGEKLGEGIGKRERKEEKKRCKVTLNNKQASGEGIWKLYPCSRPPPPNPCFCRTPEYIYSKRYIKGGLEHHLSTWRPGKIINFSPSLPSAFLYIPHLRLGKYLYQTNQKEKKKKNTQ